jgi:flagellar basal-body rod modification protein FlgD
MITQLQQQDPTNPTDSNQLLSQMSEISTLQSNSTMQDSLKSLTLQQSIGAGGNLIGKTVQGLDATGTAITGVITSVSVKDQSVSLGLDSGTTLPMANVTSIATPAPAPAAAATTAGAQNILTQLAQLLTPMVGAK